MCRRHLLRNWQAEAARFLRIDGKPPRVCVLTGLKPYQPPEADIYIIHYLLLRGWKQALPQMGFRAVIFDEIQELRHGGTEKYSAASLLAEECERFIGFPARLSIIRDRKSGMWSIFWIFTALAIGKASRARGATDMAIIWFAIRRCWAIICAEKG